MALAVLLAAWLSARLGLPPESGRARAAANFLVLLAFSWVVLVWARAPVLVGDDFPLPVEWSRALPLWGAGVVLAAAAFLLAGRGLVAGLVFGLVMVVVDQCASEWPALARAIELSGATFFGPLLGVLVLPAVGVSAVLLVEALIDKSRSSVRLALLAVLLVWLVPTYAAKAVLARGWGYGPRSLAEAAQVPTKAEAPVLAVAWLYPSGGEAVRVEERRMSDERVDLTPDSLSRLERFLERRRLRDVFAVDALAATRRGWLMWWEAEKALDAALLSSPGRAAPDYRRALELFRAGPLTDARLAKLRQLDALAEKRGPGFEGVTATQYIFEGFSAAYARFGLEEDARRWLYRIDRLWPVNDKRIEVTPVEDMRDGRIDGRLFLDGRPAVDVRVGLFFAWRSTATNSTHYFLSGSTFPDEDGRFSFTALGPGRYHLALLGEAGALAGRVRGSPGFIEIGYDRPEAFLSPIRLESGTLSRDLDEVPPIELEAPPEPRFLPVPGRKP